MNFTYHLWGALALLTLNTNALGCMHNSHFHTSCSCNQQRTLLPHHNAQKNAHTADEKKESIQKSGTYQSEWHKYVPHAVRALIAAGTIAAVYQNWDLISELAECATEHKITTVAILISIAASIE